MDIDDHDHPLDAAWKLVHMEVYRAPSMMMILCAAAGAGTQVLALMISLVFLSLVGIFYPGNIAALYSAALLTYAGTASIAGIVERERPEKKICG